MDPVRTLFQRHNKSQDEVANDVDDTYLKKSYDKALGVLNIDVAKRVAMSTNTKQRTAKAKKSDKDEDNSLDEDNEIEWKAGMPCRAVYADDGVEYEAFLVRILDDNDCVVRYIGYNNTEVVSISSLKPSKGNVARMKQLEEATKDEPCIAGAWTEVKAEPMEINGATSPSSSEKVKLYKKKSPKKKMSKSNLSSEMPHLPNLPTVNMSIFKNKYTICENFNSLAIAVHEIQPGDRQTLGSTEMPMPPPPPPISLSNRSESEEQAISTMLLSWYMTGYYTGLYQGMKRERDHPKN